MRSEPDLYHGTAQTCGSTVNALVLIHIVLVALFSLLSSFGLYMRGVRSTSSSSWLRAVSMELKFSNPNWLSLEPFSVPGHQRLKPVLNTPA